MNIDERLDALTQSLELMAKMQQTDHEDYEETRIRTEEVFAQTEDRLQELAEEQARGIAEIRRQLSRAIRLSIQEARQERKRRQELQNLMKQFLSGGPIQ